MSGIFTQRAASILAEVDEFYMGGFAPWYHGTELNADGRTIAVYMDDPQSDERDPEQGTYNLTATQIKKAYTKALHEGYALCCHRGIATDGIGSGCAQDLDITLQIACYGDLVFG